MRRPDPNVLSPWRFAAMADESGSIAAGHALDSTWSALSPEVERPAVLASPGSPA